MNRDIELLSPAGSKEAFIAGVENGSDAIYMGGKLFNARQYASNFEDSELIELIEYGHKNGVRVYITMNISLKEEEISEAMDYVEFLYKAGADALIVQDLGLAKRVKESYADLPIHASTQMTIHNSEGVKLLQDSGFSRVVLSRELSLLELAEIKKATGAKIEVFAHGALCISYSGQCLMSSVIGGRSGNRGRCAQTCRMPFDIHDERGNKIESRGEYLLSPKDLKTIDYIGDMIEAGVDSFKIEGRMKSPEYVATVVSKYREAIDLYLSGHKKEVQDKDLEKVFNRGFTKGFLGESFGKDLISLDRPNNRGLYVGDVLDTQGKKARIKLNESISVGDGLTFRKDGKEFSGKIEAISINRRDVGSAELGQTVQVKMTMKVESASKAYKTFDLELDRRAKDSYDIRGKVRHSIELYARLKEGENPVLEARLNDYRCDVSIENVVERAKNVGLSQEKIEKQLSKLGNTDYSLKSIEVDMDENIFIPMGALNELRRLMVEKLDSYRVMPPNRITLESKYARNIGPVKDYSYKDTKLSIKVKLAEQLYSLDWHKLDRIYMPLGIVEEDTLEDLKANGVEIYIYTDRIVTDREVMDIGIFLDRNAQLVDGVATGNMGVLNLLRREYPQVSVHADLGFNIFNADTVRFLEKIGVRSYTLSSELNFKEIEALTKSYARPYEALAYGYSEVMVMKHCPMALVKRCGADRNCDSCKLKSGYSLNDRKNIDFAFLRENGKTKLYNSKRIFIPEYIDSFKRAELDFIRLDFTVETEDVVEIQDIYYDILKGNLDKSKIDEFAIYKDLKYSSTKGHYFRGVL